MPYVSKSIDKKTVNGIVKDFMDKRMSYQHLSIKYELPIRDIKFHLSTKLEVPQCSLIAPRSLKHRANSILSKPPPKVVRMTIDVLAHRLDLLDSSEPLENKTLQQIGDYHGTSKQRIEQIEQQVKKYLLIKELERTDDQ